MQAAIRAHRLVTLTGVGGVGKTRLALESVARQADEFPDGVWLFELAAVTDPTAVPDAVAAVLGVTQQPHTTMADSVAATLEDRMRLLVFDNCEHLRDATADLVEAILARSTTVKIVATSREGLGLADEQLWPVPSLDVGAGTDSAAVALFVERTRSVAPRFSLTDAREAAAVVEICNRVDGIPLAIELAASRMASMSPIEVRDRLDHRFRLLVGSRRGLERHQTLRHAVAWSYDLLGDDEKELLERCSVFAGGFDLESACAIAGFDEYAVLDLLDALVRKSLLVADRPSGRTRFSMLETIRQFAEEQLVARGKANEVRTAHSRYFAGREAEILAVWDSPRQRAAYEWLTAELANLRTAFRWAADQDDLDTAAAIAITAALLGFLIENNEPAAWAEELIEPARAADHPRLTALLVLAALCWMHGLLEAAVGYVEAGLSAMRSGHEDVPFGLVRWCVPGDRRLRTVCRVVPSPYCSRPRPSHRLAQPGHGLGDGGLRRRGQDHREWSGRRRGGHRQSMGAVLRTAGLWLRLLGRRSTRLTRRLAPRLSYRARQRYPIHRDILGSQSCPTRV